MYNNEKTCKECWVKRYANTNWCFKHWREREKLKKETKILQKKQKKELSKAFQRTLRKRLHSKMWKLMSEWIRKKDANPDGFVECYTCDKIIHYKEANAGHFKHDRLDGDERNLKVQCVTCNKYYSGRLDVYAERLIRDYGLDWFNQLVRDAWSFVGYTTEDYARIINDLKNKLSKLE